MGLLLRHLSARASTLALLSSGIGAWLAGQARLVAHSVTMASWSDVRRIARWLPKAEETTTYGEPCFKVAGKLFAWMSTHEPGALVVRVDPDEQSLIAAARPELFFVAPHYRGYGAVLIRLEMAVARDLADPIEQSYRLVVASKKRKRR
jgi:hypothetical protein